MVVGSNPTLGVFMTPQCITQIIDSLIYQTYIMPIKKSAAKAARQAVKKRAVNVDFKDLMKSAVKAVKKAVEAKADNVTDLIIQAQKRIDKASKRNIITKQSASRKKSTLMKSINTTNTPILKKEVVAKAPKPVKEKKETKATKTSTKKTTTK